MGLWPSLYQTVSRGRRVPTVTRRQNVSHHVTETSVTFSGLATF